MPSLVIRSGETSHYVTLNEADGWVSASVTTLLHTRALGVRPLVGLSRSLAPNAAPYLNKPILGRAEIALPGQGLAARY
jgi:hypothetical protein